MLERAGFRLSCIGVALLAWTLAASAGPARGGGSAPALGAGRAGTASMASAGAIGRVGSHRGFGRHHSGSYRGRHALGWPGYFDPGFGGGAAVVVLGIAPEASAEPPEPGIPVAVGIRRPPEASPVLYQIEGGRGRAAVRVIRLDADGSTMASGARIVTVKAR